MRIAPGDRWRAQLNVKGHTYSTKWVATQLEAAIAYNGLCKFHGVKGRRNPPEAMRALSAMAGKEEPEEEEDEDQRQH